MKACEHCINSTIVDWDWDEKNKKSIPHYWCEKHKLETRPTFLCYMYDAKEGIDAKPGIDIANTSAKVNLAKGALFHCQIGEMKCETCTFCCRKEKNAKELDNITGGSH